MRCLSPPSIGVDAARAKDAYTHTHGRRDAARLINDSYDIFLPQTLAISAAGTPPRSRRNCQALIYISCFISVFRWIHGGDANVPPRDEFSRWKRSLSRGEL